MKHGFLLNIVNYHPGKAGDHALALLLDLGMSEKEMDCLTDDGIRRFQERRHNVTYYTIGTLCSTKVLEAIDEEIGTYLSGDAKKAVELLGVLARIAEHAVDDVRAADLASHLVQIIYALNESEDASRLAMAGNLLPSIDSSVVGELFSNLFLNLGADAEKRIHAVYVQILRMRECEGIRNWLGFLHVHPMRF